MTKPRQPHTVPPETQSSKSSEGTPSGRQPGATEDTIRNNQAPDEVSQTFCSNMDQIVVTPE